MENEKNTIDYEEMYDELKCRIKIVHCAISLFDDEDLYKLNEFCEDILTSGKY